MEEYEKTFENYWKAAVCKRDGSLNVDRVKRELHDYLVVMTNAAKVYMHVTGGKISKPNTLAFEVIDEADRNREEFLKDFLKDQLEQMGEVFENEDRH